LGGFIDGDGYFGLNAGKYPFCEITVHIREVQVLAKIKKHLHGSIQTRTAARANITTVSWRLHKRDQVRALVLLLNGYIQTPTRYAQFARVCSVFNISPQQHVLRKTSS